MAKKLYPFSIQKHAHDIEFYRNRLLNTRHDLECGEIPFDQRRYDRICDMLDGDLEELYNAICYNTRDGVIAWLTGKQYGLAQKIMYWASEQRASSLIAAGKTEYLQYC